MSAKKVMKSLALAATAQNSHVAMRVKNVIGWLKAGHEVNVSIKGRPDRRKYMEDVMKQIETKVAIGAKVTQRQDRNDTIRFVLKPTADAVNLKYAEDSSNSLDVEELVKDKDLMSDEFVKELEESISQDSDKLKKK